MNSTYLCCLVLLLLILYQQKKERDSFAFHTAIKMKKRKGAAVMGGVIEAYIGKDCIVYTLNSQVNGVVKEVRDGWVLIDNGKDIDAVNLEYVVRVRQYPKNKKGKRAAIVTD